MNAGTQGLTPNSALLKNNLIIPGNSIHNNILPNGVPITSMSAMG
jgi:hypothetical protein